MTELERYEALQEYNRFETLVNTEEYVTEDEFNFIVKYDKTEESNFSLVNSQYGDIIGSRLGVDVLLFNPALHSRKIDVNHEYSNNTYKRTIILGTEDDVVDPELTKKLWSVHGNVAIIDEVEGMGHRTPLDVFINMYNKHS